MSLNPEVLGISLLTSRDRFVDDLLHFCNNFHYLYPIIPIIIGGIGATILRHSLSQWTSVTGVVCGEGEIALRKCLENLQTGKDLFGIPGVIVNGMNEDSFILAKTIADLDKLPFLARDTVVERSRVHGESASEYQMSIYAGRGCYGQCRHCSIKGYLSCCDGKAYRQRSIDKLVNEIRYCYETYGNRRFLIWDDCFISPKKQGLDKICKFINQIVKHDLSISFGIQTRPDSISEDIIMSLISAGLKFIFIGVENFNQNELDFLNRQMTVKTIHKAVRILFKCGFSPNAFSELRMRSGHIVFTPFTTIQSIRDNLKYFLEYDIPLRKLTYHLRVYTGTEMWKLLKGKKLFSTNRDGMPNFEFTDQKAEAVFRQFQKVFKPIVELYERMRNIEKVIDYHSYGNWDIQPVRAFRVQTDSILKDHFAGLSQLLEARSVSFGDIQDFFKPIIDFTSRQSINGIRLIHENNYETKIPIFMEKVVKIGQWN